MKTRTTRTAALVTLAAAAALVSGCASLAVTGDAIEKNTARTLGLTPGTFTVSNREDDGVKTTYNVETQTGKRYACYVTGTVSMMGRVVSDAICTEQSGGRGKPPAAQAPVPADTSCNALLRAAGRCK